VFLVLQSRHLSQKEIRSVAVEQQAQAPYVPFSIPFTQEKAS
jgi:hypothetical protein